MILSLMCGVLGDDVKFGRMDLSSLTITLLCGVFGVDLNWRLYEQWNLTRIRIHSSDLQQREE